MILDSLSSFLAFVLLDIFFIFLSCNYKIYFMKIWKCVYIYTNQEYNYKIKLYYFEYDLCRLFEKLMLSCTIGCICLFYFEKQRILHINGSLARCILSNAAYLKLFFSHNFLCRVFRILLLGLFLHDGTYRNKLSDLIYTSAPMRTRRTHACARQPEAEIDSSLHFTFYRVSTISYF